jgi:hypothetical protein
MTIVENHKHTFAVGDLGDTDNDIDRSIVPSIESALKNSGIDAVVDGEEMNASVFYVYTKSNRATVEEALKSQEIWVE